MPPCDRCRRLKMDCLKNLSSCGGCTKKHARCHWKEVSRQEVQGLEGFEDAERLAAEYANGTRRFSAEYAASDTSMDVDARSPFDYPSHTAATTPGGLGVSGFTRPPAAYPEVPQQQQPYPPPQPPQPQPYEDNYRSQSATVVQRPSFPEDLTQQQQHQHQQQQSDRTMDLLRVLSNHDNGTPVANTTTTIDQHQNRNNGAFRAGFTSVDAVAPAVGATNGQGAVVQDQGANAVEQGQRV
jgi:hypothetical protein